MTLRPLRPLSVRQSEIATLVGIDDKTYREIAEQLGISEHTVARQVQDIAMLIDAKGLRDIPPRTVVQLFVQTSEFWMGKRRA